MPSYFVRVVRKHVLNVFVLFTPALQLSFLYGPSNLQFFCWPFSQQVESSANSNFNFKTHPNIDKNLYSERNVLGLKDPSRPFPTGNPLGILKWRMQSKQESMVPLSSKQLLHLTFFNYVWKLIIILVCTCQNVGFESMSLFIAMEFSMCLGLCPGLCPGLYLWILTTFVAVISLHSWLYFMVQGSIYSQCSFYAWNGVSNKIADFLIIKLLFFCTVNCWPSLSGGESYVNIEYEASRAFELQNVVIHIPLPAIRDVPTVNQVDGEWRSVNLVANQVNLMSSCTDALTFSCFFQCNSWSVLHAAVIPQVWFQEFCIGVEHYADR